MNRRVIVTALGCVMLALAGCTGVPASSNPQVVTKVPEVEPEGPQVSAPRPGWDQRTIVTKFLEVNAAPDLHHAAARTFLTPEAKNRWSDSTVTVIDSHPQIGNPNAKDEVTVRARVIGTIDASGVYTPKLQGSGEGGQTPVAFTFGLTKRDGQWRIDQLQNGLLITDVQLEAPPYYPQKRLYYFDLGEHHVIPDPRYTSLTDPALLANWLVTQLAQPRAQLQNAVSTELPAQTNPKVTVNARESRASIEVPGARQLDPDNRERLAAQLALTLAQVNSSWTFTITDGGDPVNVPSVSGPDFTAQDFTGYVTRDNPAAKVYYIEQGRVMTAQGTPMPGPLGTDNNGLHTVAFESRPGSSNLLAAGTAGPSGKYRLLVGSARGGLHKAGLVGDLSRPAWAPGEKEVWVGDGSSIYRIADSGKPALVPVTVSGGKISGAITALRFSPEGSRIALVITAPDDSAQLWIGAVVRNGAQVRVDGLAAISPADVTVRDAAWNDELKLLLVGPGGLFEVQCDGSLWVDQGLSNLPPTPNSITVVEDHPAVVSAGSTVWQQTKQGTAWVALNGDGATATSGTMPIYVQ